MAVTKLGSIKTTLSVAVDYILNPEKPDNKKYVFEVLEQAKEVYLHNTSNSRLKDRKLLLNKHLKLA